MSLEEITEQRRDIESSPLEDNDRMRILQAFDELMERCNYSGNAEYISVAISTTAELTEDVDATMYLANFLSENYHKHCIDIACELVTDIAAETESGEKVIEIIDLLKRTRSYCDINIEVTKSYLRSGDIGISDLDFKKELGLDDLNDIVKAYEISKRALGNEKDEDELRTIFYRILNSKITLGNTIEDKKEILREWTYNVCQTIIERQAGLHFKCEGKK